ncbi:MAG: asparagine synthase (glutamine-hydrolyzing) [Pseudomonadota bacterium]
MCGIAGFLGRGGSPELLESRARRMSDVIEHRGPDSDGVWVDADAGLALAHRRLAIVDLSPTGHQPMVSSCERFVVSYNGEIYNADDLRGDLERAGRTMRGTSDTEVMLEACAQWGIARTFEQLIGMFAVALWDRETRTLTLIRDRLGIKPVYYTVRDGELLFGSELKSMLAVMPATPPLDPNALPAFMRHGYIPAPYTIFEGVSKLEPGMILSYRAPDDMSIEPFWSLPDVVTGARRQSVPEDEAGQIEGLHDILLDAVGRRMVADVPLGAFLSGGIDSSTVVALMQAQSARPVRTFSIGFNAEGYDEAQHAKAVATHLGTDHTELYVEPQHAFDVIPRLADIYDEPFADSSQIPTFLVSELTRRHVTVSLSGDGGDELFAGYNRYLAGAQLSGVVKRVPDPLRRLAAWGVHRLSPGTWTGLSRVIPPSKRPPQFGSKLYKLADFLTSTPSEVYRRLISQWDDPMAAMQVGREPESVLWREERLAALRNEVEWMQYADTLTYLPDDILTKVDRASMAVALEARVPLLDHRVVAYAWSLPMRQKLRGGTTKWALRQVLYKYVPQELMERPKMGFGVPIDSWLRGPLRDWAEDLLSETSLNAEGLLNTANIRELWRQHLAGDRDWHYALWNVLMLQAWRRRWA